MDNTRDELLDLIRNATNIDMICFFAIIYVVAPDSPPYTPNATFGVANHTRRSRQTDLPQIKKVIYSGPKTIILWADNTKTIVSCGEADSYDYYSGFCAAVVKKLFGSTTHAKKVLGDSIQIND